MDFRYKCCCDSMHVTTGALVFGILDLIWSGIKLISAIAGLANGTSELNRYYVNLIGDAILSAALAGCLLHGVNSKRWRFLLAYVVWQGIRIASYGMIMMTCVYVASAGFKVVWFMAAVVALFIGLLVWALVVVEKARRYLKEIEETGAMNASFHPQVEPLMPPPVYEFQQKN